MIPESDTRPSVGPRSPERARHRPCSEPKQHRGHREELAAGGGAQRHALRAHSLLTVNRSPRLLELPTITEPRGNLSYLEQEAQVPFEIRRVYWLQVVPAGEVRGGHAFREAEEIIIALSGSVDVMIHDGKAEQTYSLNRADAAVHVPRMHWRELRGFSTSSLALIVASTAADEADYIRDFDVFRSLIRQ